MEEQAGITPTEMSDNELINLKAPARLIGFLVTVAMTPSAHRAIRWTGKGLEFVLINREIVAKMWGKRKHNTKDMDYLKLSRAIREKYDKKDKDGNLIKKGQLKKGSRIYCYEFTEEAYSELQKHTGMTIKAIRDYAYRNREQSYPDNQTPSPCSSSSYSK
ncbi:unnamed protein product [Caenorhabditis bovis]|uniref:ETS domain-containing protein n=1 Tax=Caenorhabditis bovis TaxID=2654633 RepID=A0A8S1EIP2_9PELO|nr:unnamed protein product [Caenorhabditis bovis]